MKKLILVALMGVLFSVNLYSQTNEMKAIKETITAFSKAGDTNDVNELEKYLDDNYRVVMNRLFGSTEVAVMPRAVYIEKIKSKEFGGDTRKLTIESILVNGNTASAKVTFAGSKMTFVSLITLVKDDKDAWKLVSDMPMIQG